MPGKRIFWALSIGLICVLAMAALVLATENDSRLADAAGQGDRAAVRSLLKHGADVNAAQGDGMTALHWAVYKDDAEMVQMLLSAGANVAATTRINKMTPLFWAAQNGSAQIVDMLLKAGANPNAALTTGATPLMYAAKAGNAEAEALVQAITDQIMAGGR